MTIALSAQKRDQQADTRPRSRACQLCLGPRPHSTCRSPRLRRRSVRDRRLGGSARRVRSSKVLRTEAATPIGALKWRSRRIRPNRRP